MQLDDGFIGKRAVSGMEGLMGVYGKGWADAWNGVLALCFNRMRARPEKSFSLPISGGLSRYTWSLHRVWHLPYGSSSFLYHTAFSSRRDSIVCKVSFGVRHTESACLESPHLRLLKYQMNNNRYQEISQSGIHVRTENRSYSGNDNRAGRLPSNE